MKKETTKLKNEPIQLRPKLLTKEERNKEMLESVSLMELIEIIIPDGFPIPIKNMALVQRLSTPKGGGIYKTAGGILLPEGAAKNSITPNTGVIMQVGLDCEPFLVPGMKVLYNPGCDDYGINLKLWGVDYLYLHAQNDIFAILPPETYVHKGVKNVNWMRREQRAKDQDHWDSRKDGLEEKETFLRRERKKKDKTGSKQFFVPGVAPGEGGDA